MVKVGEGKWVANLATQDKPGAHARVCWIEESVGKLLKWSVERGIKNVAMPMIGCGLGGLYWYEDVQPVLKRLSLEYDVDLHVHYR